MVDPISDMLTRIRNAQAVKHQNVVIPFSQLKFELAKLLSKHGLVNQVSAFGRKTSKTIEIELKYVDSEPRITHIKRISRPGQRIYKKVSELKSIRQGYGLAVVSTSSGLLTDKEARQKGLGGEVLCEIW